MAAAALSLPLSRIGSNQGSIAIKEHQRSKRRFSNNTLSTSPPNMSATMTFATTNNTNTGGVAARFGPAPAAQAQAQARSNPVAALSSAFKLAPRPLDPAFVAAAATATINATNINIHQSAASSVESLLDESVLAQVVTSGVVGDNDDLMEVPVVHHKSRARALLRQIFPEKLLYSDPSKDPRIFAL